MLFLRSIIPIPMKYVPHENHLLEVHLNRIAAIPEKYFVELKKDEISIASFDMRRDKFAGRWKVIEPVPQWVSSLTDDLNEAINDHNLFFS